MSELNICDVNDLLDWPDHEIQQNINEVLQFFNREVGSNDENTLTIAKIGFETCIQFISREDLDQKLFMIICHPTSKLFSDTLKGIENLKDFAKLSQTQISSTEAHTNLLHVCNEIMANYYCACDFLLKFESMPSNCINSLLQSMGSILISSFDHLARREQFYHDPNEFLNEAINIFSMKTRELLVAYTRIIATHIQFSVEEIHTFRSVDNTLVRIGTICMGSDVKSMADTLKAYLSLVEQNMNEASEYSRWDELIYAVIEKLTNDVHLILKGEQSTSTLKICNWLLKFVIKTCSIFHQKTALIMNSIISLIIILYRCSPSFLTASGLSDDIVSEIHRLLAIGNEPLLIQVLPEKEFASCLPSVLEVSHTTDPYGSLLFLLSVMRKVSTNSEPRSLLFNQNVNLLNLVSETLSECHDGMLNGQYGTPGTITRGQPVLEVDLYHYAFVCCAVFMITCPPSEFPDLEHTLLQNVLQTDPWKATLSCDLWCLLARYCDANLCHSTLDVLIPIFEVGLQDNHEPQLSHLTWLIRRLLPLCEPHYKDNLAVRYPLKKNLNLWCMLGLHHVTSSNDFNDSFKALLFQSVEWHDTIDVSVDAFTKMESILNTISTEVIATYCTQQLLDATVDLWKLNPKILFRNSKTVLRYLKAVTVATSASFPHMACDDIFKVLQLASQLFAKHSSLSLQLLEIEMVSQAAMSLTEESSGSELCDLIASFFRRSLTSSNSIIKEAALDAFSYIARTTILPAIITLTVSSNADLQSLLKDYLGKNLKAIRCVPYAKGSQAYQHNCSSDDGDDASSYSPSEIDYVNEDMFTTYDDEIESMPKRMKVDGKICEDTLLCFQKSAVTVLNNYDSLTIEQRKMVRKICNELNKKLN